MPDHKIFFDEHYSDVLRSFLRRGCSIEDARDLTQETFLQAFRSSGQYRGEASLRSWVLGIARNVYRGELKYGNRQKRKAHLVSLESWLEKEDMAAGDGDGQPLDRFMAKERADLFRQAMDSLPPNQQDCLLLRVDQELSYREIAVLRDISIDAVKARLFQARKSLRETLGEHFEDDLV